MGKQTGLGANFYIGGNDLSGNINALTKIGGGPANQQDVTDITQSGHARLGLQRDGGMDFAVIFDPVTEHPVLSALPTTDTVGAFFAPTLAVGAAVACLNAKQINYDWTRGTDGSLTGAVSLQANGFGLEWGVALTAGKRTDTAATNGTSNDFLAASPSFGAQAYLQAFSFTGTDVTVKLQDSADNSSFADVTGGAFTQITGSTPLAQRIATAGNLQIRRYVRAVTITTGGFSSLVFAVAVMINQTAEAF